MKTKMQLTTLTTILSALSILLTSCGEGPEILSGPASQSSNTSGQGDGGSGDSDSETPPIDLSPPLLSFQSNPLMTVQQWIQFNSTSTSPLNILPPDGETPKKINEVVSAVQLKLSDSLNQVIQSNQTIDPSLVERIHDQGIKIFVGAYNGCSDQQLDEILTEKGIKEVTNQLSTMIDQDILPVSTMSATQLGLLLTHGAILTMYAQKEVNPECSIIFMINISSVEEAMKYHGSTGQP